MLRHIFESGKPGVHYLTDFECIKILIYYITVTHLIV